MRSRRRQRQRQTPKVDAQSSSEGVEKLAALIKTVKLSECSGEDLIDLISHEFTAKIIFCFVILVLIGQLVGDPIQCWCPAQFTVAYEAYTKNYCWIKNTYYIPMLETIPHDIQTRQEAEITYYQWVPLILMLEALLFKIPHLVWKMCHKGSGLCLSQVCELANDIPMSSKDDYIDAIEHMSDLLDRWLLAQRQYNHDFTTRVKALMSRILVFMCNKREGTYLTALYLTVKVLYLGNVIAQFFLLNAFMANDYNMFGFEYLMMMRSGIPMKESPRFPRITLCDFEIRELQNIQRWTVQCVLPVNLFYEKIFIFLWFWFFAVACLSGLSLLKWVILIVVKRNNYQYVKKYLTLSRKLDSAVDRKLCRRFAENYLRDDGCFVARIIGMNSNDMVLTDLLKAMWINFKIREHPQQAECGGDSEDEQKALEKEKMPLEFEGHNMH